MRSQIISAIYSRILKAELFLNLLVDYSIIRFYAQFQLFHVFRAPPWGSFFVMISNYTTGGAFFIRVLTLRTKFVHRII